ncbi:MAG: lysophospholipid acyltransferase family protein [Alphaproteobacteria bacterium]|jgi:1-acyl-sn-glycerol-3-phosphate acyltransferase
MFRSILFAICFYTVSAIMCLIYLPFFVAPRVIFAAVATSWMIVMLYIIRYVLGIKYVIKGAEHRPKGAVIYAAKHQSAWDVIAFKVLVSDCAYVLKRELYWIPLWGWYVWRCGMIGVDRDGGGAALKTMVKSAIQILKNGRSIVIFPQGTRTSPGADRPYLPGIAALYTRANTTVVPVALNSGLFWPRRQFQKFPGTITVEFLPPIPPGLKRRDFMKTLEERIETATRRLEAEAQGLPVEKTVENPVGSGTKPQNHIETNR